MSRELQLGQNFSRTVPVINFEAAFFGMGATFQIWQPEAGEANLREAIAGASAEFESMARNGTPEGDS